MVENTVKSSTSSGKGQQPEKDLSLGETTKPTARTGTKSMEACAETIEFPDLGITLERGDKIITNRNDRPNKVFHSALMNSNGMWAIQYCYNGNPDKHGVAGGHGPGWLKMKLRNGEWEVDNGKSSPREDNKGAY